MAVPAPDQRPSTLTDAAGAASPGTPSPLGAGRRRRSARAARLLAAVLGLLGAALSASVAFLPVSSDITTVSWPTAQGTRPVSAPLVSFSPVWLDAHVPCASARGLDARTAGAGTLFSSNAPGSDEGKLTGLVLQIQDNQLAVLLKGQRVGTARLPPGACTISVHSDASATSAAIDAKPVVSLRGEHRPQLTGIYSALDSKVDDVKGLSVQARVDNRWQNSPTALKGAAMGLAVAAFAGSVIALRRMDGPGRRPPGLTPRRWWKPTLCDLAVYATLVVWWLIGAITSDDGYILTIARARADAGYISNYYRWFAVPEAPFGWFYELYSAWVQVSTATPWVRLPALCMGVISWLLVSRTMLPRLGQQVRRSHAAGWAAAAVFLAFWLPYNNGLRPEPVVVLFSLLALCAVEHTVATGRLTPAAVGLTGAALAVGANPHGLVAVLPYIAAAKPLVRLVRMRAREFGWVPVLAPIAASGLVILTVVFWDQTWTSVREATALRTDLGPREHWYQELDRYNLLFSPTIDGSLARRFPVLLVILCLVTCVIVLLRRGRIRGAALGPARRLLGVTALSFAALALTPTKWTHHFGVFAAVGGALAALTALATSSTVLRSQRNRAAFFAGLMLICAFAATGPNGWWYVSGWGVPWYDKVPSLGSHNASTYLLAVAALALVVAFVEHLRLDERDPDPGRSGGGVAEPRSRALRLGTAPLTMICAVMVVLEVAAFVKAIDKQWGGYSVSADSVKQLSGQSCGLSDSVYVEPNPLDGTLRPAGLQPGRAAPATQVPEDNSGTRPARDASQYLQSHVDGFRLSGLPPGYGASLGEPDWKPPHRFGGPDAPVWGSYDPAGVGTGELRTPWYELPASASTGQAPVVVSVAGATGGADSLSIEFGRDTPMGFETMERRPVHQADPHWSDARVTVNGQARGASKIRVVAADRSLGPQGWVAVSAPRVPRLTKMTDYLGRAPAFVDWPAAFVHPCLQLPGIHGGIAQLPAFRVAAGADVSGIGLGWSSAKAGGPFGWMNVTATERTIPTYLKDDLHRDWGSLHAVEPYEPGALPPEMAIERHQEIHWGTWTPGPLSPSVQLPDDVPNSEDRGHLQTSNDES